MSTENDYRSYFYDLRPEEKPKREKYWLNVFLFLLTVMSTVMAGTLWAGKDFYDISNWGAGVTYSILLLTFLSAHEFGHYFAARYHGVKSTLPFYIPMPFVEINFFGTFGAVIKTRTPIITKKALFDIGVAGPLAGFVVSVLFLIYGFSTLPGIDYIYNIHPNYLLDYGGKIPETSLFFGDTLLYWILAELFKNPNGFLPPMNEMYHYPFLNVGWFGLFVTTLNLLPFGQLDGGHISYAMFGKKQGVIAKYLWWLIIFIGIGALFQILIEVFKMDYTNSLFQFFKDLLLPALEWLKSIVPWYFSGWGGWLFWALIARFFIKIKHPPLDDDTELDSNRRMIGWAAFVILLLSISYNGIYFVE
jgi:membrane-associated protease RseP (regulator of RpoE activity)